MTAYRDAKPSETALQWARWKRISFLSTSIGTAIFMSGFGFVVAIRGCNRSEREAAEREAAKPCVDELHTGTGHITCLHREHTLDVVTYQGSGAALCRCRGSGQATSKAPER